MFIVGVLATMFTISVGVTGGDRQLESEADRLIAVIDLAREEAVIQGREIGLRFYNNGYEFSAFYEDFVEYHDEDNPDQSEWVPLDRSTLLGPRQLPDGLRFELEIDGREVILMSPDEDDDRPVTQPDENPDAEETPANTFRPQVMVYSSGDLSPFTVQVRREFANRGTRIEFDIDGSVEIETPEQ